MSSVEHRGCDNILKQNIISYYRSYYLKNKERILANNIRYYYEHKEEKKEYHSQNYQEQRSTRLEYQKQYNKEHQKEYNTYQLNYYHNKIKNDPEHVKRRLAYHKSYRKKKNEFRTHERQIKRTELLMTKMLRELLKKVPRYEDLLPLKAELEIKAKQPEIAPFAGFRTNAKGLFVLDW